METTTTRIGFSTSTHLLSRLIRHLTRSPASHAFLLYWDEDFKRDMVLEANGKGFNLIPFDLFQRINTVVEVRDLGRPLNQGLVHVSQWIGTRYDGLGMIGMGMVLLGRILKRRWANPLGASSSLFCSEAIVRALIADGFPGASALDPESTSPADLMVFLSARQ